MLDVAWRVYRKGGLRSAEELQRTIVEIETKYKAELGRAKKKYESDYRELEIQNENLSRANNELAKANKSLAGRVKVTRTFTVHRHSRITAKRNSYDNLRQFAAYMKAFHN